MRRNRSFCGKTAVISCANRHWRWSSRRSISRLSSSPPREKYRGSCMSRAMRCTERMTGSLWRWAAWGTPPWSRTAWRRRIPTNASCVWTGTGQWWCIWVHWVFWQSRRQRTWCISWSTMRHTSQWARCRRDAAVSPTRRSPGNAGMRTCTLSGRHLSWRRHCPRCCAAGRSRWSRWWSPSTRGLILADQGRAPWRTRSALWRRIAGDDWHFGRREKGRVTYAECGDDTVYTVLGNDRRRRMDSGEPWQCVG